MKVAISLTITVIVVMLGLFAYGWLDAQKAVGLRLSLQDQAQSIYFAEQVLATGAEPKLWPTRVFLPASAVKSLGKALTGAEYVIPVGSIDSNGQADGRVHIKVNDFDVVTSQDSLTAGLLVTATYVPERNKLSWSKTNVDLEIHAMFMPLRQEIQKGIPVTVFRFLPTSVTPHLAYGPLSITAGKFVSKLIAAGVITNFGDSMLLPVPGVAAPLDVNTNVASSSYSSFPDGGVTIDTTLSGHIYHQEVEANTPLVTSSGIWMLGGLTAQLPTPPAPPEQSDALRAWIEAHRSKLAIALAPFQNSNKNIIVRIPKGPILAIAAEIQHPSGPQTGNAPPLLPLSTAPVSFRITSGPPIVIAPSLVIRIPAIAVVPNKTANSKPALPQQVSEPYSVQISTRGATGTIGKVSLMRDDTLGSIGAIVTPRAPDFARGDVVITPPAFVWTPKVGLTATIEAHAAVHADLHLHVNATAIIGGGIGTDVGVHGEASAKIPLAIRVFAQPTPLGTAIVLEPTVDCVPIHAEVRPDTPKVLDSPWIHIPDLTITLDQNIGGQRLPPTILVGPLPRIIAFPKPDPKAKASVRYAHKSIKIVLSPKDAVVDAEGIEATSGVAIEASDLDPDKVSLNDQQKLTAEVLAAISQGACDANARYALVIDNFALGPQSSLFNFIAQSAKDGAEITNDAKAEAEKFFKKPLDAIASGPHDALEEGSKITAMAGRTIQNGAAVANDAAAAVRKTVVNQVEKTTGIKLPNIPPPSVPSLPQINIPSPPPPPNPDPRTWRF